MRTVIAGWSLGTALLISASAALAQSVHEVVPGGDTVTGTIADAADVDRIPFRLPRGAVFSLAVKADKGSLLHPAVTLLGTDRDPEDGANLVTAAKGNAVSLKNFAVPDSGLRWLEIRGADGTTGPWTLTMKVKLPKKAAASGTTANGAGVFPFVSPGGATAVISVSAGKGSAALPEFQSLLNPSGGPVLADIVNPTSKGFVIPEILLGPPGDWTLRFTTDQDGTFTAKASFKVPKPFKRVLAEQQVITDPVLVALDPSSADISQTITVTAEVDFLEPGGFLTFRKSPTVVTIPSEQLTPGPGTASFLLVVGSFTKGVYGVDAENPDGGKDSLEGGFTVNNAPARLTSVIPAYGRDDEVATLTITGSLILSGATASLVRGPEPETIAGTGIGGSTAQVQGQFDLRGRTQGFWDMVVTNPDSAPTRLASAFEIRNAPPTVSAMSPGSDRAGSTFTAVVTGAEMEGTPSALLRRTGTADIQGTNPVLVNPTLYRVDFDTTGASAGARDLVVTNPDAQSGTLAEAFWVGGVAGPPVRSFVRSNDMDGPPALLWNPTRGEFALAWIETASTSWDVYLRRLDATGAPVGSIVSVSAASSGVSKRDVALAWNSAADEYLVAWSEYATNNLHQVFVRRVTASDLTFPATQAIITDNTSFSGWPIDNYNNYRPSVAWNPSSSLWEVVWMQEWSQAGDDYDVLRRTYNPSTGALGTVVGIAYSPNHEGDPCAVWDSQGSRLVVAYVAEVVSSGPMDLYVGTGTAGTRIVTASSGTNISDPRVAVDTTNRRLLLTWTVLPSSGNRTVQALLGSASSIGSTIGTPTAVGTTGDDDFLARPLYSASLGEGTIAWTRRTSTPSLQVMIRRVDTSGFSGLSFLGSESELSGGSGDEACPAVASKEAAKETAFFWLKGLTLSSAGSYNGSVVPGTYRGKELWMQRFR